MPIIDIISNLNTRLDYCGPQSNPPKVEIIIDKWPGGEREKTVLYNSVWRDFAGLVGLQKTPGLKYLSIIRKLGEERRGCGV
jgi:hypothetical protein